MRGDFFMADAGEQGAAGLAPIDPMPESRGRETQGSGDVQPVKIDMGQGRPPVRRPPARSGATSGAAIVTSAVLALLCGGAGAWAYERFLAPKLEKRKVESAPPRPDAETQNNVSRLEDRINGLSDQFKHVQARLESVPKSSAPPDLAPLEQKVARVEELSQQLDAVGKKLDPLPRQLAQLEQKLADLDAKTEDLRKETSAARSRTTAPPGRDRSASRASAPSPGDGAEPAPPPPENGGSGDSTYETGVSRFRNKQYRGAYDVFRKLLQSRPDDARIWYYAAVSYGLATGDWGRDTEVMVQEGIAREKASKPPKPEIDAALAGLTKETGKEWLDYYRQRAR
jgi:TolA-binding protein